MWETLIADATKRLGGKDDNRCRVTVTDRFGGRGHDYQVMDKEANANGGMLVIASLDPRSARVDPGKGVLGARIGLANTMWCWIRRLRRFPTTPVSQRS